MTVYFGLELRRMLAYARFMLLGIVGPGAMPSVPGACRPPVATHEPLSRSSSFNRCRSAAIWVMASGSVLPSGW